MNKWTKKELNFLKKNYNKFQSDYIAKKLNRSRESVLHKASNLKLKKILGIKFSQRDFLKSIKTSKSHTEAMSKLGYKNRCGSINNSTGVKYFKLVEKLSPNISHFSLSSRSANKKSQIGSSIESFYNFYKRSANKRRYSFSLSLNDFLNLVKNKCYYCNSIGEEKKFTNSKIPLICCGIDRRDNAKGYSKENCVPCCKNCNFMKKTLSEKDFINHIKKILTFYKEN